MRAYGHTRPAALSDEDAILALEAPAPQPGPQDLLVAVRAVSVNPVDYKVRANLAPDGAQRILGWDAAGEVLEVGAAVSGFAPGDRVYYAGDLTRPGSNAEQQAVDARIAAKMPATLDFAAAAALPLTAITAWEMLFDRLLIGRGAASAGKTLMIIGGAGGVGSIAIQLARALTEATVIATASRPESADWVRRLGAHHVVNHRAPFAAEVQEIAPDGVDFIFSTNATGQHWETMTEAAAPQGRIGIIDDPEGIDISRLKMKSLSLSWEFMFTRSMFATPDIAAQGALLAEVAGLVDAGKIRTTATEAMGAMSVETLRQAHARLETGTAIGKMVLTV
ncbi:MAG: zinc-binding alcohol dehydrogenase family protein [Pseudomonadota bacterium]